MTRVRMLKTLPTPRGLYEAGKSYEVGESVGQVKPIWAASWTKTGHAEEDKSIGGAPEQKDASLVELKVKKIKVKKVK